MLYKGKTFVILLYSKFGELRDGAVFSLGKINVAQMFNDGTFILTEENLRTSDIEECGLIAREVETIEKGIDALEKFLDIKQFDDEMEDRLESDCQVPQASQATECLCECHKQEKLAIYGVFTALKMIDQFDIQRFGDLYTWYYHEKFQGSASDKSNDPEYLYVANPDEVINLEKQILSDLRLKEFVFYNL